MTTTSDKELLSPKDDERMLLELAAKAADMDVEYMEGFGFLHCFNDDDKAWNPLTDDGDALRLAVKLGLMIDVINDATGVQALDVAWCIEQHKGDPYAATRRAIVRAAAKLGETSVEIGKQL